MTLLAGHIAPLPHSRHVDRFARRELTEHIAALCAAVHGTRYGQRCQRCTGLAPTGRVVAVSSARLGPAIAAHVTAATAALLAVIAAFLSHLP